MTTFGGRAAPPDASLAGFGLMSGPAACAGAVNPATGRESDNKVGRIFMIVRLLATRAECRGPVANNWVYDRSGLSALQLSRHKASAVKRYFFEISMGWR
jgi:hypothetical protein